MSPSCGSSQLSAEGSAFWINWAGARQGHHGKCGDEPVQPGSRHDEEANDEEEHGHGDGDDESEQESQEYQYQCECCGHKDEALFRYCPRCTGTAARHWDQEEQEEEEEEQEHEREEQIEDGEEVEGPRDVEQLVAATSVGKAEIKAQKLPGIQRYDPVAQTAYISV